MDIRKLLPEYLEYLRYERQLAESSINAYQADLKRLIAFVGSKPVAEITRDDLRALMRDMTQKKLSTGTVRRHIHGFNTFWDWLKLTGRVEENVAELIQLPKLRRKVPDWLDVEELERWVNTPAQGSRPAIRHRNMTAWRTMAWLGLRRGELLRLEIKDVRLADREIVVRNSKGKQDRVLPIPEKLYADLKQQIGDRPSNAKVFASQVGKRWVVKYFSKAFHAHVKACGLADRKITPHTLRHTFATQLIRQGVDLSTVARLMGHKDIKTTMIYIQHDPKILRDAMDKHVLNTIETPGKEAGGIESRSDL